MNKKYFIVCMACVGVLFSLAGFVSADTSNYPALICSSGVDTCDAKALVGDKFSISLDGNASTGYTWNLDYDKTIINLDSSNSVSLCPSTTTNGITIISSGCGQTTTYNFSALKPETVKITATYSRLWESVQPAQTKYYNVAIYSASINGVCGTAAKTYYPIETSYGSNTFCSSGTTDPLVPSFPAQDNSTSWICSGLNGGSSVSCAASRSASSNYVVLACSSGTDVCSAKIPVGGKFSISLDGNASTGYAWSLDYDKTVINLDYSSSVSLCPSVTGGTINQTSSGCGQTTTYNFSALKPENAKITATYSRSWESVQPVQIKKYSIEIASVSIFKSCSSLDGCVPKGNVSQKLGPITIDKPLNQMTTGELLQVLINLIQALVSKKI